MEDLNMLFVFELIRHNNVNLHTVSCLIVCEKEIYSENLEALPL